MLSRVADALFWMSRYVERADYVARLLETNVLLDLDLMGLAQAGPVDLHWQALIEMLHQQLPEPCESLAATVAASLTFDLNHPSSLMACINRSRNNARSIRGSISPDLWRELNKLYWQLTDAEFRRRSQDSPHELYQAVQIGSQTFQGVCDATLTHDEGWRFIQLGKYLERADKTLRILDCRHRQLKSHASGLEPSLLNLHWASVLKSCQAFQAYQHLYISRVEPERVVEFLLLNAEFPYSVRFCLRAAADHLTGIGGAGTERPGGAAARVLGRAVNDLEYLEPDDVHNDLHQFLHVTRERCLEASAAMQRQYSLT